MQIMRLRVDLKLLAFLIVNMNLHMISLLACGLTSAIQSDPKQRDFMHTINPAASAVLQGNFIYDINDDNKYFKYKLQICIVIKILLYITKIQQLHLLQICFALMPHF